MFSHMMIGVNDMTKSKEFYDAALGELGVPNGRVDPKGRAIYMHAGNIFLLTKPIDGNDASAANGGTLGFSAATSEEADAFHKAGVANGGVAIEDAPGWREGGGLRMYLAYLRDPAGNKICAMCRG